MSWEKFKSNLSGKMREAQWSSSSEFALYLANEYKNCISNGSDIVTKNKLKVGNYSLMVSLLNAACSAGLVSTDAGFYSKWMDLLGKAIVGFWSGAQLDIQNIPTIPAPGTTANIQVTSNIVINPGTWPSGITVSPNEDVNVFINNFINAAKVHLTTISGQCYTISQYPTPAPPGPGIVSWQGYEVNPKKKETTKPNVDVEVQMEAKSIKQDYKKFAAAFAKYKELVKKKKAAAPGTNNVTNAQAVGTLGKPGGGDAGLFKKCGGVHWPAIGQPGAWKIESSQNMGKCKNGGPSVREWYTKNEKYISANCIEITVPLKRGSKKILVHKNFAAILEPAFAEIKSKGLNKYINNCAGGLAVRNVTCGTRLSNHAWGTAIDLNTDDYVYGPPFVAKTEFDFGFAQVAAILVKAGCTWLNKHDPMHFSIYE